MDCLHSISLLSSSHPILSLSGPFNHFNPPLVHLDCVQRISTRHSLILPTILAVYEPPQAWPNIEPRWSHPSAPSVPLRRNEEVRTPSMMTTPNRSTAHSTTPRQQPLAAVNGRLNGVLNADQLNPCHEPYARVSAFPAVGDIIRRKMAYLAVALGPMGD